MSEFYRTVSNGPGQFPGMRRVLTAAGEAWAKKNGRMPPDDNDARADSAVQPTLVETVTLDDANRKIKTFAYTEENAWKSWMEPYRAVPQRQLFLNNQGRGKEWCKSRETEILAREHALAQQIKQHGVESIRASFEI